MLLKRVDYLAGEYLGVDLRRMEGVKDIEEILNCFTGKHSGAAVNERGIP